MLLNQLKNLKTYLKNKVMLIAILISLLIAAPISYLWVRGIDNMKKNHPNYKGEDFLNWDDDKTHTEGNF